ncbi:hypothetical protein [Nocardioides marmorisolisilvae]|uniref:ABC-2 type transport system permease protein n=1 Tax=Nocardioides marmorisolisilvae TaxID=1542737 RepID=A0A3N0DIF8_9ACTN|nr:hypothetical protein [Nocardioides marmorisolisilvae]RNL75472.1 hypothetical protein EFL95_18880 [Nocardioides marmorisolisilvae]
MPTEHSWTELRRGAEDLRALLAFRRSGLTPVSRKRLRIGGGLVITLTVAAIALPAYLKEPLGRNVGDLVAIMPTFYLGFLVLSVLAAVSSGGGRELVPRDQAVAYPVSTVTEHLGALLLAPLNVAWLIQAWALLGSTTYIFGPHYLPAQVTPVLLWIVLSTAVGQVVGWAFEGIRRGPHGTWVARGITTAFGAGVLALVLTHTLTNVLDHSPTVRIYLAASYGGGADWGRWSAYVAVLLAMIAAAVLIGLLPARWALQRPQREELRLESGHHEPPPNPRSDLVAMVRLDRASVWRSVPLRRGLLVLGMMPGVVALGGALTWDLVTILPGLVASGGALLFGVNAWCLDGRGALWRDSLPTSPRISYLAKVVVLFEVLLVTGLITIALAAFRAGRPTAAELVSVLAALVVVAAQVVATSMRWSVTRPYASDMRSARATPAPPVVMAGYSARLAVKTTVVGLVFSATAIASTWLVPFLVAVPMLLWSAYRLARTESAWAEPLVRARVVAVVAS